jgi:hypothetical protein
MGYQAVILILRINNAFVALPFDTYIEVVNCDSA